MPGIWGNSANIILSCSSIRLILPCFSNYLYRSSSLFEFLSILMGLDVIELPNILSSFLIVIKDIIERLEIVKLSRQLKEMNKLLYN